MSRIGKKPVPLPKGVTAAVKDEFNEYAREVGGRLRSSRVRVEIDQRSERLDRKIRDAKLKKVQASIQGDQVRVTSPSKDDLQDAMRVLRGHDFGVALQFGNYR